MKLKPFDDQIEKRVADEVEELPDSLVHHHPSGAQRNNIKDLLSASGIGTVSTTKSNERADVRDIFKKAGAGIEEVAETVAYQMRGAQTDVGRLKAAELAMKVHGVFEEIDEKQELEVHIHINGNGNNTLIGLLQPRS